MQMKSSYQEKGGKNDALVKKNETRNVDKQMGSSYKQQEINAPLDNDEVDKAPQKEEEINKAREKDEKLDFNDSEEDLLSFQELEVVVRGMGVVLEEIQDEGIEKIVNLKKQDDPLEIKNKKRKR